MKKTIILFFLISLQFTSFSQSKFGVVAGVNNSALTNSFLEGVSLDKVFSLHFGGIY